MLKIQNPLLSQLFMETSFVPKVQQLKQLAAAEELYRLIELDRQYPHEFIFFQNHYLQAERPNENTDRYPKGLEPLTFGLITRVVQRQRKVEQSGV